MLAAGRARADVRAEARQHFRRGMELVEGGRLDEGLLELERAYDILPHPNVVYNIARAYSEAGRYGEAIEYFERYLESDPVDREEVRGFIVALETRLDEAMRRERAAADQGTVREVERAPLGAAGGRLSELTDEEIRALEEGALQIETMAEATDSDDLRARAERLRRIARMLEEGRQSAEPPTMGLPAEVALPAEAAGTVDEEPRALAVGARREDVFEETVVSASRIAESPLDAPNSTTVVTAQDIRLSGITDLPQLLRRVAGVHVYQHTPSHTDIAIRGLATREANKVLVLLDGRTLRLDFLGSPFYMLLPIHVQDIERIEVIRGPAAAVYGADAFSGIINIITRQPGDGSSRIYGGVGNGGTYEVDGSFTDRRDRIAYRFGGGYRRADNFELLFDPSRVDLRHYKDEVPSGRDVVYANGDVRYSFGRGNYLRFGSGVTALINPAIVTGIGAVSQMQADDAYLAQTHIQLYSRVGVGARVYWNAFGGDVDEYGISPGALDASFGMNTHVLDAQVDLNREFRLGFLHNVTIGGGYRLKTGQVDILADDIAEHHVFFFVQDSMRFHQKLSGTLSVRADRHPLFDDLQGFTFSPRGSLVYRLLEGQSLRLTVGTAFRNPSFFESYLDYTYRSSIRGTSGQALGNDDLDPERMISAEIGYQNQATDYLALEVNAYYNFVTNEMQLARVEPYTLADGASGSGGFVEDDAVFLLGASRFENQPSPFRQMGGEVGLRVFPVSGLDIYANYAYNRTEPTRPERLPSIRLTDQRTPEHMVNAGVQYRSRFGLDLSADLHVATKSTWVEQIVVADVEGIRFISLPLSGYQLLNARVGYRLFDDRLELGVAGFNLLFQERRQHPLGQTLDTRIIGQATVRF